MIVEPDPLHRTDASVVVSMRWPFSEVGSMPAPISGAAGELIVGRKHYARLGTDSAGSVARLTRATG